MLGFDDNCSNSTHESSSDSSDDLSAKEQSKSKKMAQHVVFCVHVAPEEVFEQSHMIPIVKYPHNKLIISIIEISIQFFICFVNLKTVCAVQGEL